MLAYSAASLGIGAFYIFNNAALPLFLRPLTDSALLVGLLSQTRSIEGAVIQPLVGTWSDRLRSPLGRRRPFLIVAIPAAAVILALTPLAPSLGWAVAAIVLFALLFNVAVDPFSALLADIAPLHQRATVNSLATLVQFVGQVATGLVVAQLGEQGALPQSFLLVSVVLVASFAVTILGVREPARPTGHHVAITWREYLDSLAACREAQKFFAGLFVLYFGMNGVVPFLTLYAVNEIRVGEGDAVRLVLIMVVITGALAVPFGRLGDRGCLALPWNADHVWLCVGPAPAYQRLIGFGIVCLGLAALLGAIATEVPHLIALEVLAGIGNAALSVLWWPMLTTLIPRERTGVFAGFSATVQSIALPASVVVAGGLVDAFGTYRVVFGLLAVSAVLALLVFRWVQPPRVPESLPVQA
jgi:maltose/moltooligosaccharide transporter